MRDMGKELMHALREFYEDEGFWCAICECGWETPGCPDVEDAANFWGQHLLAVTIEESN